GWGRAASVITLLGGLALEVTQVLRLAGSDDHVLEEEAGDLESAPAGRAVMEAGDQPLDGEPAVVVGPDAGIPVAPREDVVRLGVLARGAVGAHEDHPLAGSPLVVADPAGDRSPRLELDDDRRLFIPLEEDRADQLAPLVHAHHPPRLARCQRVDLEAS